MFWVVVFLWGLAAGASAITITVDGNLFVEEGEPDWGVDTSSFGENDNNWDPGVPGVFVWQEDEVGENDGFVDPGYGGQNYDVEAVLATFDANYLYVAIATGFPQIGREYGSDWYDAGDIAFDVGADGSWDYALVISTYVDGNDNREAEIDNSIQEVELRGFYKVFSWQGVSVSDHSVSNPFRMKSGTQKGTVDESKFYYVADDPDLPRYIIEAAIPLSLFDEPFTSIKIHWTMECGNDYGEVVAHTPEPASILLAGAGLFAVSMFLRRRRREG